MASKVVQRIQWGSQYKSRGRVSRKLARDLRFYGGTGAGNCAMLDQRNPQIVEKRHRDGTTWFCVEVDDVALPLEYGLPGTTENLRRLNCEV